MQKIGVVASYQPRSLAANSLFTATSSMAPIDNIRAHCLCGAVHVQTKVVLHACRRLARLLLSWHPSQSRIVYYMCTVATKPSLRGMECPHEALSTLKKQCLSWRREGVISAHECASLAGTWKLIGCHHATSVGPNYYARVAGSTV